jgi:hypothetical protein
LTLYSWALAARQAAAPNLSLAKITATQRLGASCRSTAQRLYRPNGKIVVTASSVRESASAGLWSAFQPTWTCYASHPSPSNIISLIPRSRSSRPMDDLWASSIAYPKSSRYRKPPRSPWPPNGGFGPRLLGLAAYMPSRSLRPTAAKLYQQLRA